MPDSRQLLSEANRLLQAGRVREAEQTLQRLLSDQPDNTDALNLLGAIALRSNNFRVAADMLGKVVSIRPDDARAHYNLGFPLVRLGRVEAAAESFQKAVSLSSEFAEAHNNLGNALKALQRLDDAVQSYRRALAVNPDYFEAHNNLGNALKALGNLDDAAACFRRALSLNPDYGVAYNNLGSTLMDMGRREEAITSFRKAIEINPSNSGAHANLGKALKEQGGLREAVDHFGRALEITPRDADTHNNLGSTLYSLGRSDEAEDHYARALEINPRHAAAHYNLGILFQNRRSFGKAVDCYQKAIEIDPVFYEAHDNLGTAYLAMSKTTEAMACFRRAIEINPQADNAHSNLILSLNYRADRKPIEVFEASRRFGALLSARFPSQHTYANNPDPNRPLRVGLVSGDFNYHSVSYFLDGVLAEIDGKDFLVHLYATSPKTDEMTERLKRHTAQWRDASKIDDEELTELIIDDRIDILIDLSGHSSHNRLAVFARKPAPIQVTWLGYSATTGLESIDYVLCDEWVLPEDGAKNFTEKPWRLPHAYLCFTPPVLDIRPSPLPSLTNPGITFGSFNNLSKVTDDVIACWAAILNKVPDSQLLLKARSLDDHGVKEGVYDRFSDHGIASDRLVLLGYSKTAEEHFDAYHMVDVALDPFPYNGTTTSFEALWMGVPVLAREGDQFISRVGVTILRTVGLEDWIATSTDNYIEKAVAFASDRSGLVILRETLRVRLLASPLCDNPLFARNLEVAWRDMWRRWCASPD